MNSRHSIAILLLAAVIFNPYVRAQNIAIYRWVDDNNVVHFSQQQPKNDQYSQLTTFAAYEARDKQQAQPSKTLPSVSEQIARHEKEQAEIDQKNKTITANNCKAAQLNIKMLNSFEQVMMTDTDGKDRMLTDKEKKQQVKVSKKHILIYCNK